MVEYCSDDSCYLLLPCLIHNKTDQEPRAYVEETKLDTCPICLERDENSYTLIDQCNHYFCKNCLASFLTNEIDKNTCPILCPYEGCKVEIYASDVEYLVSENTNEKYLKNKNEQAFIDIVTCPNPECATKCYKKPRELVVHCLECRGVFCIFCKSSHCTGDCEDYASDFDCAFSDEELSEIKRCPRCANLLWLEEGCPAVICTFCKVRFCWKCEHTQSEINRDDNHDCDKFVRYAYNPDYYASDGENLLDANSGSES